MDAVSPAFSDPQCMDSLRPRIEPAVLAVGGPLPPLIQPAQAAPVDAALVAIARLVDPTLLKPEATPRQIDQVCDEALENHFAAVCVHSGCVGRVAARRMVSAGATRFGTSAGVNIARQAATRSPAGH